MNGRDFAGRGWMTDAACKELPPRWWTETDMTRPASMWQTDENKLALLICADCPVRRKCCEYSAVMDRSHLPHIWGIWGGLTPAQRHRTRSSLVS